MSKLVILLAALVARGFAQAEFKGSLPIDQCSAVPKCLGELPVESFPQTPDTADTTKPKPLIIGGVYVPVLPGDQKAPNWITSCVLDVVNCPKGYNLTGVPKWPPPQEDPDKPIPGHPFNPVGLCSKSTPGCDPRTGLVVPYDPINKCDARYPGCLADDIPSDLVDAGNDPACPKESVCKIINAVPCHPNQASLPISCMKVDPIPCVIGTLGCNSGTKLPDPVQPCVPNSVGCSNYGIRLPPLPNSQPNDPVIPPGNHALVIAPQGTLACAFTIVPSDLPQSVPPPCPTPETITVESYVTITLSPPTSTVTYTAAPQTPEPEVDTASTSSTSEIPEPSPSTQQTVTETVTASSPTTPVPTTPVELNPSTKFPCSSDDNKPCLGDSARPNGNHWVEVPGDMGANGPIPAYSVVNNPTNENIIMTVTDLYKKMQVFSVWYDDVFIGNTSELVPDYWAPSCENADECIEQGFSHGYFSIPPGEHTLKFEWSGGYQQSISPDGSYVSAWALAWSVNLPCSC
ncbi:hypothetical protein HYFRA_00010180 [Hymenoscyphus fraxineus]|uniref:Uncharacterized protein n=1 Tax=Hymenoscyphus fraxineus TaxID=746836 RepID=A0A9N9KUP7_9HELO|nr:hypothetical protein HYFRA_00010180 [Hymenoscyphus fraxineus]